MKSLHSWQKMGITERKMMLQSLAFYDSTGLRNRRVFTICWNYRLKRQIKIGEQPALMYMDLGKFKEVDDFR